MLPSFLPRRQSRVRPPTHPFRLPVFVLFAVLLFAACDNAAAPEADQSLSLRLSASLVELERAGDTTRIQVLEGGGASQVVMRDDVIWSVEDSLVVTVDGSGLITARNKGETSVIAKTRLGRIRGRVKVKMPRIVDVSPQADTIRAIDEAMHLSVEVTNPAGRSMPDADVSWISLDSKIATVNASGVVVAKSSGTAKIRAASHHWADTAYITVEGGTSVSISPSSSTLAQGDDVQLSASATDASGELVPDARFTWSSSDESIATVSSDGLVQTIAEGEATITAALSGDNPGTNSASSNGRRASAPINVRRPGRQTIRVSPGEDALRALGDTIQLTAVVHDSKTGDVVSDAVVTWTSLNPNVAIVDELGRVVSRALGVALITAATGSQADTAVIESRQVVAAVEVSPAAAALEVGDGLQYTAAVRDSNGIEIPNPDIVWTSTNTSVATVRSSGWADAVAAGSAAIRGTVGGVHGGEDLTVAQSESDTPPPSSGSSAELPRTYIDTGYREPSGERIRVRAGDDLQAAIDRSQPGDIIELEAGATFTGSFTLPAKSNPGGEWIVIRSATSLPVEGTRVTPATAAGYATIMNTSLESPIKIVSGASYYRIMGVEVTTSTSRTSSHPQIVMQPGSHHIVVDRSYVHGHATLDFLRCINMNASHAAVIDSYVADCHSKGFDSQAILAYDTPGPLKIENNYLGGAGENVMIGGAKPAENVVPSDIVIRGNHFFKPRSWDGVWAVKNLFEIKFSRRVLIEGNVFENSWTDGQTGTAIVLKHANQGQDWGWTVTEDITFRNNKILGAEEGFGLSSQNANPVMRRLLIENNHVDVERRGIIGINGITGVVFRRNTIEDAGAELTNMLILDARGAPGLVLEGNLFGPANYGVMGSGQSEGTASLDHYAAGWRVTANAFTGRSGKNYPSGNHFPATFSTAQQIAGVGVDMNALEAAISGVVR